MSFFDALSQFENLERELDLPYWQINGVYVWKLIRFSVFVRYRVLLGQITEAHPEMKSKRKAKSQYALELPRRLIKHNPFFSYRRSTDRIVIPHSRKRWMMGRLVDPISTRAWVGQNEKRSLVLDRTSALDPTPLPATPHYDVMKVFGRAASHFVTVRFNQRDMIRMSSIQQRLNTKLTFDGQSFAEYVFAVVRTFIGLRAMFSSLYQKLQPKALYLVVGYGLEAAIAAAKERGITVAEFQHGTMDRGHFGYDYRGWDQVPYFADHMLSWGEAWHSETSLPQDCMVHPVGAPHIELMMRDYGQSNVGSESRLLVLSQGPVARNLMNAVIEFSRLRPDWEVVVRPHPSESARSLSADLQRLNRDAAGRIHVDAKCSLSEACSRVSVVFGASSTALVESLLAGCKLVILRSASLPPRFQSLLDSGDARAVRSGVELADCIDFLAQGSARSYFAEPVLDVRTLVEN